MVARKRKPKRDASVDDIFVREGVEQITSQNANEQFSKLLVVLDRIDDTLFETVLDMRRNRKLIDADLEQIGRNNDEIDALIKGLRANG